MSGKPSRKAFGSSQVLAVGSPEHRQIAMTEISARVGDEQLRQGIRIVS